MNPLMVGLALILSWSALFSATESCSESSTLIVLFISVYRSSLKTAEMKQRRVKLVSCGKSLMRSVTGFSFALSSICGLVFYIRTRKCVHLVGFFAKLHPLTTQSLFVCSFISWWPSADLVWNFPMFARQPAFYIKCHNKLRRRLSTDDWLKYCYFHFHSTIDWLDSWWPWIKVPLHSNNSSKPRKLSFLTLCHLISFEIFREVETLSNFLDHHYAMY